MVMWHGGELRSYPSSGFSDLELGHLMRQMILLLPCVFSLL